MADFFKGLSGGMHTGLLFGRAMQERQERERLREAMGLTPQEIAARPPTQEELGRAQAETRALAADDERMFPPDSSVQNRTGLFSDNPADGPAGAAYAPQMPYVGQMRTAQYRLGDQTFSRMPTQQEIESARYATAANVIAERDPVAAARMRQEQVRMQRENELFPLQKQLTESQIAGQGQQRELTGIQIGSAKIAQEKEVGFNSAMSEINKTEYKTPAERDAAVLKATEQFKGPEAKAALQANYSTNERNNILIEGAKFDQTIKQARLKGPAAALKAIDDLNDSFKLEIDGFKVTQVNNDGTRVPFLQGKNADEFALLVDSRIRDGGAFELAKFRQDELTKTAQIGYYNARAKEAGAASNAVANQLSGVQVGYSRDAKGDPVQVMSGLRFNKKSGQLESVQVQLEQNVVPASALDPKKIAEQAESLVGTPTDPTNKNKDAPKHTFATAQQAVVDQIFNQYLGTGISAGGLDLSPEAVAKRAREQAEKDKKPAAAPAAAPAPRQTGSAGIDTSRPRTDVNPVTNLPRETPVSAPNLVAAASRGLDAGQARYKAYLEGKIAANQALTPDEAIRAKRFGLQ